MQRPTFLLLLYTIFTHLPVYLTQTLLYDPAHRCERRAAALYCPGMWNLVMTCPPFLSFFIYQYLTGAL